ncbi:MAG: hypothetical protein QME93_05545 [Bacillota bacterium]|nr:hypothetical protein [Bacillota bacterium]MDI7249518.1 hypothetical protein [Bacillota bacterium]
MEGPAQYAYFEALRCFARRRGDSHTPARQSIRLVEAYLEFTRRMGVNGFGAPIQGFLLRGWLMCEILDLLGEAGWGVSFAGERRWHPVSALECPDGRRIHTRTFYFKGPGVLVNSQSVPPFRSWRMPARG